MLYTAIAAHLVICAVYYFFSFIKLRSQERACRLILALSAPVFGVLSLILSDIFKGREEPLDIIDRENNLSGYKYIQTINKSSENNTVPLEEVLLVNNYEVKRKILLDIFKSSPDKYIKELKLAIEDPDTETSHYASAALMEINRKYQNSIFELGRIASENPDNFEATRDFAVALNRYIGSGIPDDLNRRRYQKEFLRVTEALLEAGDREVPIELYSSLAVAAYELGESERAFEIAERVIEIYPENEVAYLTQMRLYYQSGRVDDFKAALGMLTGSPVILSGEGLSAVRFFLNAE